MRRFRAAALLFSFSIQAIPVYSADPWPETVHAALAGLNLPFAKKKQKSAPIQPLAGIPYEVGRHLRGYKKDDGIKFGYEDLLPTGFLQDLLSLKENQHWMDVGAGAAIAMLDYLSSGGKARATGVTEEGYHAEVTAPDGHRYDFIEEAKKKYKFEYVRDPQCINPMEQECKGIEKYSASEFKFGQADIITDVYGAVAYSDHIDQVFSKFGELLKKGGRVYTFIPVGEDPDRKTDYLKIADSKGRKIDVLEWFRAMRGFEIFQTNAWNDAIKEVEIGQAQRPAIKMIALRKTSDTVFVPPLSGGEVKFDKSSFDSPIPFREYVWTRVR